MAAPDVTTAALAIVQEEVDAMVADLMADADIASRSAEFKAGYAMGLREAATAMAQWMMVRKGLR